MRRTYRIVCDEGIPLSDWPPKMTRFRELSSYPIVGYLSAGGDVPARRFVILSHWRGGTDMDVVMAA